MEINGIDIVMSKPIPFKNFKHIKRTVIIPMKTKKALDAGKSIEHAQWLDYEDVKEWVDNNKKMLFKGGTKYLINVLLNVGWRAGKEFKSTPNWVSFHAGYGDKDDDVDEILAFEILTWDSI